VSSFSLECDSGVLVDITKKIILVIANGLNCFYRNMLERVFKHFSVIISSERLITKTEWLPTPEFQLSITKLNSNETISKQRTNSG
jgi:hypothetical protein